MIADNTITDTTGTIRRMTRFLIIRRIIGVTSFSTTVIGTNTIRIRYIWLHVVHVYGDD